MKPKETELLILTTTTLRLAQCPIGWGLPTHISKDLDQPDTSLSCKFRGSGLVTRVSVSCCRNAQLFPNFTSQNFAHVIYAVTGVYDGI